MIVSIIIVNYKSSALLLDCLCSFLAPGSPSLFDVIVVDNYSQDDSETVICSAFPQVRWLQMGYNSGFARANNTGIKHANGDIILLLNPDTLIQNSAIERCSERLEHSEYIACSAQLLNADGSPQITGNYFMKGGLNHLMALPYLGRFIRYVGLSLKVKKTNVPEAKGLVEVDWINGAFLMVKKSAIAQAGLLDEDFFLYSEEIEWCSRLGKVGKMCVYGDLHVVHLQGESAKDAFKSVYKGYQYLSDKKGLQLMLSGLVRIRKQFGIVWFLLHLATYIASSLLSFIITFFKTLTFNSNLLQEWKNWWGFCKNLLIIHKYIFPILSNKPYFYKAL